MKRVTPKEFVKVWAEAYKNYQKQEWVGRKLGLTKTAVTMRKKRYRKLGLDLPELTGRTLEGLNEEFDK